MKKYFTFDDVLIEPQFSYINSRKDIDLSSKLDDGDTLLKLPILSANMDTVTGYDMAVAMGKAGGLGVLHRFMSDEENVKLFEDVRRQDVSVAVSIGVGERERDRAVKLYEAGARLFVLDVAHGAQMQVVEQYDFLKNKFPYSFVVVGNFASAKSVSTFIAATYSLSVDAIKVGVGPGSACTTRIKTGIGVPQLSAVLEIAKVCKKHGTKVIADGGMRTSGDIAKALAAGADAVMLGGMLSGTDESEGENVYETVHDYDNRIEDVIVGKKYRGSASKASYDDQGKHQDYITAEGEAFTVKYKGKVAEILKDIEGGLRSAFSYVGARNLAEFKEKATLIKVSANSMAESSAHGKSY